MPRLGETMEEGRITEWLVKEGEAFERGAPLLEVETDKTAVEFPALGAGTLTETLVAPGDTVAVGSPIARIDVGDGPDWTCAADDDATAADPAPAPDEAKEAAPQTKRHAPEPSAGRVRATPLARRLARRHGIDLAALEGSGRRGRVERCDVERAAGSAGDAAPTAPSRAKDETGRWNGLAYSDIGPEGGAPFLLIHGFSGDRSVFAGLASALARGGCRAVSVDLPGHGESELEAETPDALSPAVLAFAREVFAGTAPHIVGSSMGAIPAVAVAEGIEAAALSLIGPVGLGLKIDGEALEVTANATSAGEIAHIARRFTHGPNPMSEAAIARVAAQMAKRRLTSLAAALHRDGRQTVSLMEPLARLGERMTVRIIVGHQDPILDFSDAMHVSPRVAVHHFPACGHMPHWEAPRETLAILLGR